MDWEYIRERGGRVRERKTKANINYDSVTCLDQILLLMSQAFLLLVLWWVGVHKVILFSPFPAWELPLRGDLLAPLICSSMKMLIDHVHLVTGESRMRVLLPKSCFIWAMETWLVLIRCGLARGSKLKLAIGLNVDYNYLNSNLGNHCLLAWGLNSS